MSGSDELAKRIMRDLKAGGEMDELTELVLRDLATRYSEEVARRTDELIGDLDGWRPTGFPTAPVVTDPDCEASP